MSRSRHSIANALAKVRVARAATSSAELRHARSTRAAAALRRALRLAVALEAELLKARRLVREATRKEAA